jgi:hypothetical protein
VRPAKTSCAACTNRSGWPGNNSSNAARCSGAGEPGAKAVASAAHAVNATKVAANVPHAWTKTAIQKHCLWTTRLAQRVKHRRPTKTVANVVSVAHAIATAVTAASVATAHRVKKVLQSMATTNKPRKTLATRVSHANRVNPESLASHVSAKSAVTVRHGVRMRRQQRL